MQSSCCSISASLLSAPTCADHGLPSGDRGWGTACRGREAGHARGERRTAAQRTRTFRGPGTAARRARRGSTARGLACSQGAAARAASPPRLTHSGQRCGAGRARPLPRAPLRSAGGGGGGSAARDGAEGRARARCLCASPSKCARPAGEGTVVSGCRLDTCVCVCSGGAGGPTPSPSAPPCRKKIVGHERKSRSAQ